MVSISALSRDALQYYIRLEDDYSDEATDGIWLGTGAARLGLTGTAKREGVQAVFEGFDPFDGRSLVRNAGSRKRRPGWDLTFSPPKSLSVLWALSDDETRAIIERIHLEAVAEALGYLEESAAFTRRGGGGKTIEPAGLVAIAFPHATSRALDPQVHTHVLVINAGVRADGTSGSLLSTRVYDEKLTTGAVYRSGLAARVISELGLKLRAVREWFEIDIIPDGLIRRFSARRSAIEAFNERAGKSSAKASALAALETRQSKSELPREALFEKWQEEASSHGYTWNGAKERAKARDGPPKAKDQSKTRAKEWSNFELDPQVAEKLLGRALQRLTETESYFTEHQLFRAALHVGMTDGVRWTQARTAVRDAIQDGSKVILLSDQGPNPLYTTREVLQTEHALINSVKAMNLEPHKGIPQAAAQRVLSGLKSEVSENVKRWATELVTNRSSLSTVISPAGSQRDATIAAASLIWQAQGLKVVGAAIGSSGARLFEARTGIPTATIAKRRWLAEPSLVRITSHVLRQLGRAARGKRTYTREQMALDATTVLIAEQAGLIGTKDMLWLIKTCREAGAKLVIADDLAELPSVASGNPLRKISELGHTIELGDSGRPSLISIHDAAQHVRQGNVREAFDIFEREGHLRRSASVEDALTDISKNWTVMHSERPSEALVVTPTPHEAARVNTVVREQRARLGQLGQKVAYQGDEFFVGDRVLFTQTSRKLLIGKGVFGTVQATDPLTGSMAVELDDGTRTRFKLREFSHIVPGYAVSAYQARGLAVDHAHVLLSPRRGSREEFYSQISCGRVSTTVYEVGVMAENRERTVERYERAISKGMAIEVPR